MSSRSVGCPCDHGQAVYQFLVETGGPDGDTLVRLCQACYDRLKGSVLQDAINEAVKYAVHRMSGGRCTGVFGITTTDEASKEFLTPVPADQRTGG